MKFFYCASGPEGEPVLVIRPFLQEDDIHTLKVGARQKTFACGDVISGADGLIFESDDDATRLLELDLKRYFSKKVSALQNARVITRAHTNTQGDFALSE